MLLGDIFVIHSNNGKKRDLDGSREEEMKGAYADSLSTASRCALWNSFNTACKSFANLASAIFLLAYIQSIYN